MVKVHESSFTHDYPFPTVTLAYFLRYPNPYSTHVMSTDVIERHFDPQTNRLYTARLHLKRSKMPAAILKLLPRSLLGASPTGTSQSYVLERSVVDVRDGVMITESRNLDLVGVLAVVERQLYRRPDTDLRAYFDKYIPRTGFGLVIPSWTQSRVSTVDQGDTTTNVSTKVELYSKLGQAIRRRKAKMEENDDDIGYEEDAPPAKQGFFRTWTTNSIQRSIEAIGLRRTERAVPKSKDGMNVVLARLRTGGLVAVLEGMRRDRENADVQ